MPQIISWTPNPHYLPLPPELLADIFWIALDAFWNGRDHIRFLFILTSHVLTECESPGQALICKLAKRLWKMKGSRIFWSFMTLGDILGCGLEKASGI
ncbi:hypothetical protein BT96DRAFT_832873 [Gymnopus androsaceus JB14]|uniref:Uncharacterized protein n=1 Tax=Gymnopus androsaceus JB14 TaxID=1447944 RepID=A0A6A4GZC8_9AGAR|nr:hypothetical protein BT96DRAFT_832873 [Gymnopus androsaceus JB14]